MEYVQERVTTLHDFGDATPTAPTGRTTVVVPMTERDHASLAAERVLAALERVDPKRVVVALRATATEVGDVVSWVSEFDIDAEVLWCTAPRVESLLADAGLDGNAGKGRDVWLALGVAADSEYVVVHDADAKTYTEAHVPKLLFPLANGHEFSKGYYARVENNRLYGRLFRLFYAPLVRALDALYDDAIVDYFDAFRYGLAGEFAVTGDVARQVRAQRSWGLEVGTLGEAFRLVGFERSAQVDLGVHEHDHRSVGGPQGLGDMCREVGSALFRALADAGVDPSYDDLATEYCTQAERLVDQYAADAGFNGLTHDRAAERQQVDTYVEAIEPPAEDCRLPAWVDTPLSPADVLDRSRAAIADATE
ncbi:glycosyl transferase family 2 [Salinibaculum rarum]|uniref:glycosyl transferase family 2 n=1 Tax=Salinibaculum rarum TaxID=3058903 RepID=UPI00265F0800|nr:glycosyl transferase family 2 [Salinibaculum sp. KK48]